MQDKVIENIPTKQKVGRPKKQVFYTDVPTLESFDFDFNSDNEIDNCVNAYFENEYLPSGAQSIVLDWLEINGESKFFHNLLLKNPDTSVFKFQNYTIIDTGLGLGYFGKLWNVQLHEEPICSFQSHPRKLQDNGNEFSIQMKIENRLLYTDYWLEVFNDIKKDFSISVNNVTRCDIAIDGANNVVKLLNDMLISKSINAKKVGKGTLTFHSRYNNKQGTHTDFTLGKGSSPRSISVYCKSKEIKRNGYKKDYIIDFWHKNGINTNENAPVVRCEIRLKNEFLKTIDFFTIQKLIDKEYLASVYKLGLNNFFEFVEDTGKAVNREKKIELFDWSLFGAIPLTTTKIKPNSEIWYAQKTVKFYFKVKGHEYLHQNSIDMGSDYINDIIDKFELKDWLIERLTKWKLEVEKEKEANIYRNINRTFESKQKENYNNELV